MFILHSEISDGRHNGADFEDQEGGVEDGVLGQKCPKGEITFFYILCIGLGQGLVFWITGRPYVYLFAVYSCFMCADLIDFESSSFFYFMYADLTYCQGSSFLYAGKELSKLKKT